MRHQIILFFAPLGVHAGPIYAHTTLENLNFAQNVVRSLATAIYTKATSALTYPPAEYIYPVMLCLMKIFFPSRNCMLMLVRGLELKLIFFPVIFLICLRYH